ncbi:hypothetical protein [Hyphomicrobium sp.]|uniref:hypothetical protein n=1 Tax=Hyphomicrobium sp. TaxID=82 RepID=UPI002D78AD00|nr:hypothetical protein [Hyphomicrobium sp.]HET6388551.1 hypothetical protein [Hyphomicrobium sp.]
MKSLVAGLSLLIFSFMALSAYSLTELELAARNPITASVTADAAMTPDSGTSGVGYAP